MMYAPDMSRHAKGFDLWVALKYPGKASAETLVTLVDRLHESALSFAENLQREGLEILDQIAFNQGLVS
jgi:hypothetical protein